MRVRMLWIGVAACFCAAKPTDANLVVFEFTGLVTAFDNSFGQWTGHPFENAAVGQSFALQYGFESTTPDIDAGGQVGAYLALVSMRVTVGSTQFEYDSFSSDYLQVANDQASFGDFYQVFSEGTDSGNNFLNTLFFLGDVNATTFGSDALPTSLVLSDFENRYAVFNPVDQFPGGELIASIDNFSVVPAPGVVPPPGAVVLALIGLPMVAWLRRRVS